MVYVRPQGFVFNALRDPLSLHSIVDFGKARKQKILRRAWTWEISRSLSSFVVLIACGKRCTAPLVVAALLATLCAKLLFVLTPFRT